MPQNNITLLELETHSDAHLETLESNIKNMTAENALVSFSYEQIIKTFSQVYRLMAKRDHPLYSKLRHLGLSFFLSFIHSENLKKILIDAFGEDVFLTGRRDMDSKRMCQVSPRGLALHWLAGNVPILGLISVTLSLITKNQAIIKLPSSGENYVSDFLDTFLSDTIDPVFQPVARAIHQSCIVTQFPHEHEKAAELVSKYADTRLLWGSQDAIDFSKNLPSVVLPELISFGPKLSAAVIEESSMNESQYDLLMTDILLFQQMACTSPQFVFVKGGASAIETAIESLKKSYDRIKQNNAHLIIDQTEAASSILKRLEYAISLCIKGYKLHSKPESGLIIYEGDPDISSFGYGYGVIGIKAIENIKEIKTFLPKNIQGIYYAYKDTEELFTSLGQKVDRIAPLGQAHSFELPWDGLNVLDKLSHKTILWRNDTQ